MPSANALLGRFYHVKSKGTVDQFDTLGPERNFGRSNNRSIAAGALYDLSIDLQNLMVER
jgi:hypothetical protein